ncbi:hypothetical protein HDU67_002586 [Dinochytrium kinnereticum]|nr:hypothetical protein HDU67_002586 [Dinochytrium kinnereticum]
MDTDDDDVFVPSDSGSDASIQMKKPKKQVKATAPKTTKPRKRKDSPVDDAENEGDGIMKKAPATKKRVVVSKAKKSPLVDSNVMELEDEEVAVPAVSEKRMAGASGGSKTIEQV